MKNKLSEDLTTVRSELKKLLPEIKDRTIALDRANTIIYCCSNITRTVIAEIMLNKSYDENE